MIDIEKFTKQQQQELEANHFGFTPSNIFSYSYAKNQFFSTSINRIRISWTSREPQWSLPKVEKHWYSFEKLNEDEA